VRVAEVRGQWGRSQGGYDLHIASIRRPNLVYLGAAYVEPDPYPARSGAVPSARQCGVQGVKAASIELMRMPMSIRSSTRPAIRMTRCTCDGGVFLNRAPPR